MRGFRILAGSMGRKSGTLQYTHVPLDTMTPTSELSNKGNGLWGFTGAGFRAQEERGQRLSSGLA